MQDITINFITQRNNILLERNKSALFKGHKKASK